MSSTVESLLREIQASQQDMNRMIRFLAHRNAREVILEHLQKNIEKRVYELSDGVRSSREIETLINKEVTQRTVVTWWQKWKELGIVEQSPSYSGRVRKLIPLSDLGIDLNGESEQ